MNPTLVQSLKRIDLGRKILNDIGEPHDHACYREYCNPLSERDLIARGVFAANTRVIASNVWLCRFGCYHVCSLKECNQASDGVCAISGLTFAHTNATGVDYDEEDSRTWAINVNRTTSERPQANNPSYVTESTRRSKLGDSSMSLFLKKDALPPPLVPPPPQPQELAVVGKKRRKVCLSKKEATKRLEHLVHILLYDERPRKVLRAHQVQEIEHQRARAWHDYARHCECEHQIADMIHHMIMDSNMVANTTVIDNVVEPDQARERYYVQVLLEVYGKILEVQDSPKIDIEAMGIAVLYHMRTGMCISGIQVLPVDHYLIQRLPQLNDLPFFQFPKRKLTKGSVLIKSLYATAMKNGVSRGELMLSTQVPTPLTERVEGKVFMPTSRK